MTSMQSPSWQIELAAAFRQPQTLLQHLGLDAETLGYSEQDLAQFPLRVPRSFADRMQYGNPDDPLLRQVFPYRDESESPSHFHCDPLFEANARISAGLLQKYAGRVLLITTSVCAIHCRYCFRRHYPYQEDTLNQAQQDQALAFIRNNPDIEEVILSGGDPLLVADKPLSALVERIAGIGHVQRLRLHSRVPVVLPSRISTELLDTLSGTRLKQVMIVHINHANEINDEVARALKQFSDRNIPLLNQSVLLKGVNDSADTLIELSRCLFDVNVIPYYLHLLDPVVGAAHFEVPETIAKTIHATMQARLSGYLVPRLVREVPGASGKVWI
ncbi:MAG: EF-P beta-lysylation protein EpmB, partial [Gammaproteobacteria bacterium]